MELKLHLIKQNLTSRSVLIVPFMELKRKYSSNNNVFRIGLNRTFYGIETY